MMMAVFRARMVRSRGLSRAGGGGENSRGAGSGYGVMLCRNRLLDGVLIGDRLGTGQDRGHGEVAV
jgi:hypothetical protein